MASNLSDREVRVQYEYLQTQVEIWDRMLAHLAGLVVTFTKDFSIQHSSNIEFNILKEMLDTSDRTIHFVRERATEAQLVARGLSERLAQIKGWYEEGTVFRDQLKNTTL